MIGEESEQPTLSYLGAALWTLGVGAVFDVLLSIAIHSRPDANTNLANLAACHALSHLIVIAALLRIYRPDETLGEAFGFSPVRFLRTSVAQAFLAIVVGLSLIPVAEFFEKLGEKRFPLSPPAASLVEEMMDVSTTRSKVLLLASIGLVLPLVEELFFRGLLFRLLKKSMGSLGALTGVTGCYLIAHGDPRQLPVSILLALVVGLSRTFSESVLPAILIHVVMNMGSALWFVFAKQYEPYPTLTVGLTGVAALGLWILCRVGQSQNLVEKDVAHA